MSWLVLGLVMLIAGVLLAAGAAKFVAPRVFAALVADVWPRFDVRSALVVARAVGAFEVTIALGLLSAPRSVVPLAAAIVIGLLFALSSGALMYRGWYASCGCFGGASQKAVGWTHLAIAFGIVGGGTLAANVAATRAPTASRLDMVAIAAVAVTLLAHGAEISGMRTRLQQGRAA